MSDDYHPYVIADGRLVGAWDEMYAACEDPWHQSREARSEGRQAIIRYARDVGAQSLVEFGCGLGFFTAELDREGFDVVGVDVSPVAIARAAELHPQLDGRLVVGHAERDLGRFSGIDAVVFAEITWYVLDHLDAILDGLARHQAGAHLIHLLTFYGPGRQRYGREYFTTPEDLASRLGLEPIDETRTTPDELGDYASTMVFRIPEQPWR